MIKFIKKIIIFFLILMFFNISSYYFVFFVLYDNYLKPKNDKIENFNKFLFGDSHGNSIKQKDLDKLGIYNFSYGSDSYFDIIAKIYFLKKNNYNVDTVLIEVDNHNLSKYREQINNIHRSVLYLDYSKIPKTFPYSSFYISYHKLLIYFPLFDTKKSLLFSNYLRSKIINFFSKTKLKSTKKWAELSSVSKIKSCKNRAISQFAEKEKSLKLKESLEEIISYCNQNNITIIGVKFPLTEEYLPIVNERNYGADSLFFEKNIHIIDLSSGFIKNDMFFENQDHLNDTGSVKFCKIFNEKLNSL